jgi:hypothetical protein
MTLSEARPGTRLRLATIPVIVRVMAQNKYGTWTLCRCVFEDGTETEPISMPGTWRGERVETNNENEGGPKT